MLPEYDFAKQLFEGCEIDVSRETYLKFENYAKYLVEYNEKVNLTRITDGNDILEKHFLDSLLLDRFAKQYIKDQSRVLDIGSGAGFPGVPLAIYREDLRFTLMDSLQKRITFLESLGDKLGVVYDAIHGRAEILAKNPLYREQFDVVTARAVAALPTLAEYSLPYVRCGGFWLAMKGPNESVESSLNAIKTLGGRFEACIRYVLPGGDERQIFVVKKVSSTPTKYPRNSSQIKQKSL